MSAENIPSPSAATLLRQCNSDSSGKCLVCGADPDLQCDRVVHRHSVHEVPYHDARLPVVGWSKACSVEDTARHLAGPNASIGRVLDNAQVVARAFLDLKRRHDLLQEEATLLRRELCDFAEAVYDAIDPPSTPDTASQPTWVGRRSKRLTESTAEIPLQSMAEVVDREGGA